MSFFDEADEPRTASRSAPRRGGSSGGRRPPHGDPQAIRVRRGVAAAVLVVLFILVVLGVHSCQVSARNSALQDYNANVVAVVQQSNATGRTFFSVLTSAGNVHSKQTSLNQARDSADTELSRARGFSVPDQVKLAQTYLLLTLQMRRDAIANVAQNIQPALASTTSKDAVSAIATEMARLYASDVVYKDYTVPLILGGAEIGRHRGHRPQRGAGRTGPVPARHPLDDPDLRGRELHATLPASSSTSNKKPAPGPHGHQLLSVSVAGTTLTPGASATLTASPPPTFTLNFTNTGQSQETNVVCKVTVTGTAVSGQTTVPQTTPGQQTSCNVPLSTAPPSRDLHGHRDDRTGPRRAERDAQQPELPDHVQVGPGDVRPGGSRRPRSGQCELAGLCCRRAPADQHDRDRRPGRRRSGDPVPIAVRHDGPAPAASAARSARRAGRAPGGSRHPRRLAAAPVRRRCRTTSRTPPNASGTG